MTATQWRAFTEEEPLVTEVTVDALLAELAQLEQALMQSTLTSPRPSIQALASTAPFCFDTMPFEAWLQWVFLPRMRQVLSEGHRLTTACSIAPLAEHQWQDRSEETFDIHARLVRFDSIINRYFDLAMPE